jgi:ATP-dependent Lon protease
MVSNLGDNAMEFKSKLPLLPVRDLVVYPYMIIPLFVGRESSIQAVEESIAKFDRLIFLSSQKDIQTERPNPEEIFNIGTVAVIMRMRKLPDGRIKILVQGLSKARIINFQEITERQFFNVDLEKIETPKLSDDKLVVEAVVRNVREKIERLVAMAQGLSPDLLMILEDIEDPGRMADLIASNLNLKVLDSQAVLETIHPLERLKFVDQLLQNQIDILLAQEKLRVQANQQNPGQIKTNKDFLHQTLRNQRAESPKDEGQDDLVELKIRLQDKKLPDDVAKEAIKQLGRLERMHPDSSEANILRTYLDWIMDLPWTENSPENLDIMHAKDVLDEDHFDLKKIKERILEHLSVRKLKGEKAKSPIICFAGPPGVGKTSLGKSIAKAMNREFVRLSLGGVKDEAEIRGHRRTYVGAMPGRIIQAFKQAKTINPVIMLDEIDKLGSDYKGDPSSALLEVLDPEQNHSFRDNYLGLSYNLAHAMFIATANVLDQIPTPLRDRMEVIHLSGYTQEEKLAISKKYLVPKQMDENGVDSKHINITDDALTEVIRGFTREAGLRNLERQIGSLCRKVAKKIACGETKVTHILGETVDELLGPRPYSQDDERSHDEVGVSTGLAWTAGGGEILYIETTKMPGKGAVQITGQLGDVMRESAMAAISYLKSHAKELGIDSKQFEMFDFHIHVPAGATPKDGPSAGVTLATAMASLLTGTKVTKDFAMTGEITLTGKVLPVGGIKEKALAAMRLGIKNIIIPFGNQKDLSEIPEEYTAKVNFIAVKDVKEVFELCLVDWDEMLEDQAILELHSSDEEREDDFAHPISASAGGFKHAASAHRVRPKVMKYIGKRKRKKVESPSKIRDSDAA